MTKLNVNKILLFLCITLVSLTVILTAAIAQETQTLIPKQDNTLIENTTGELSNGQGTLVLVGRTNQPQNSSRRGVIAFDLTDKIPKNAQITSATLTLVLEKTPDSDGQAIELHRLLKDWGEGMSSHRGGRGDRPTSGDATWIHSFYDTQVWSKPGGDFSPRVSAVTVVAQEGNYNWNSTPEMIADVQQWLENPDKNFGWLLLGNETESGTVKGFASSENTDPSVQPRLAITYIEK